MSAPTQQDIVKRIYLDYANSINNDELAAWPGFFTPSAVYRIISKENYDRKLPLCLMYCEGQGMLKDRAHASADLNVYAPRTWRHMITNISVQNEEGLTTGHANFVVFETIDGKSTTVLVAGRYLDVIANDSANILLASRTVIYDTCLIPGSIVFPI